ncbi:hypothetical protein EUTSA_v10027381mg, partial [Eutrema salsugineum]
VRKNTCRSYGGISPSSRLQGQAGVCCLPCSCEAWSRKRLVPNCIVYGAIGDGSGCQPTAFTIGYFKSVRLGDAYFDSQIKKSP